MKNQKEAERAEQQRIKNLVLSYDPESSTDQTGTDTQIYFDYFSQTNPNLSQHRAGFPTVTPVEEITLAHNATFKGPGGEKHGISHHQHNASLHQSSPNTASARPAEKSGTNRSSHRARKLQLSDVDWYGQKPGPSRGRSGTHPSAGFRSGNRRTAG